MLRNHVGDRLARNTFGFHGSNAMCNQFSIIFHILIKKGNRLWFLGILICILLVLLLIQCKISPFAPAPKQIAHGKKFRTGSDYIDADRTRDLIPKSMRTGRVH